MSARFYINCPLGPGLVELTGAEAHHLINVSRLRAGDLVCLFNGDGCQYPARIQSTARRRVFAEVLGVENPNRELGVSLEVAAPLPKGDRAQFLIEKLTELGVSEYVPLICRRSVIDPGGKLERLRRYVVESSKQCGRNVLMAVNDPEHWEDYVSRGGITEVRVFAHPDASTPHLAWESNNRIRCAVGPEGGLTEEEVRAALALGWVGIDLGPRILRIETAALVLATLASRSCAAGCSDGAEC